jgi:hypothetical protein
MTRLFGLVPSWIYAAAIAALVALLAWSQISLANERAARSKDATGYAQAVAQATAATLAQEQSNRQTEKDLENAKSENATTTQALLDANAAAAARAGVESGRLRDAARAAAARAREACPDAGTQYAVTPGPDAIGLLADVLGLASDRAEKLAAVADDARTHGLSCERDFDNARALINGGFPNKAGPGQYGPLAHPPANPH